MNYKRKNINPLSLSSFLPFLISHGTLKHVAKSKNKKEASPKGEALKSIEAAMGALVHGARAE